MHLPARRLLLSSILLLACSGPVIAQEQAHTGHAGDCSTFTWDVAQELKLLATPATEITAGDGTSETRIEPGVMYRAKLRPQAQVKLASRPGKPMLNDDAMAGLLTFKVPTDGRYYVSITTGHWIDVVDAGQLVRTIDFQGRPNCPVVHKIVKFELPAGRDLVLQFAGGGADSSGVLITAVPATAE
ncbi:MAG: hypothetical protein R3E75_05575 [Steroidobacteraceae bacterium]|nr:hypothetical protein [Nevskiaceae bacterium]